MDIESKIREMVEPALKPGQFIVDIHASAKKGPGKVIVLLDGDNGISIDDCAEISRQLSKALDETSIIDSNYLLEVSTPGVDQPLKLKRQYHKHIGRKLKVKLVDRIIEGKLSEVSEESIVLEQQIGKGKNLELSKETVPFAQIEKAFVLVSFK